MEIVWTATEHEMIAEFLQAEYASERFSGHLREVMRALALDARLIVSADLDSAEENAARKKLLGAFRGYGLNRELFEHFPHGIQWHVCSFVRDDLSGIRYINYSYWDELSRGTHAPLTAARTIRDGVEIYHQSNAGFRKAAEFIKAGGKFPRPIFLTSDWEHFVIVEGHFRITAFALVPECFHHVECLVGACGSGDLNQWLLHQRG